MNIFVLDTDPKLAAQYHCNSHSIKLILEHIQMLSTAHRILDGKILISKKNNRKYTQYVLPDDRNDFLLKSTHINHPCTIWARESSANYRWLHTLTHELCKEYTHRYEKIHKYEREGLLEKLEYLPDNIKYGSMTPFAQAMPDQYKDNNAVTAYRNYYIGGKSGMLHYKNRTPPEWIPSEILQQIENNYVN